MNSESHSEVLSQRSDVSSSKRDSISALPPQELTAAQIACKSSDAVVKVHSEFILVGAEITGVGGATPLSDPQLVGEQGFVGGRKDVILSGNGFFIKGHYIVVPAQLVLLPPSLTSAVNRYPYYNPKDLALGQMKNQMIRASRILVDVYNVNGECHSFIYEADLIGVDGAGDLAVLKINPQRQWNRCNPCINKCHPYLDFGKSRCSKAGDVAYLLGDYLGRDDSNVSVVQGLVGDHRHAQKLGFALQELILVSSTTIGAGAVGMPILNAEGKVIGLQTINRQSFSDRDLIAGPSELFMRRVIKKLIKGTCSRKYDCNLESICDPAGAYYRYKKAYLGLAYNVFQGYEYDVTIDYTSGAPFAGEKRIRLTDNGEFMNSPSCKELIGLRVVGLAGLNPNQDLGVNNGLFYVPGGEAVAPLPAELPESPLLGKLAPGDVITHFDDFAVGDLHKQITPSLITWRACAGDRVTLTYRKGGNALNTDNNSYTDNYDNQDSVTVCLADYPALMDYPWYAINAFPSLATFISAYAPGQKLVPQTPELAIGANFHPAV